jgi:hypothetical protein
MPAVVSLDKLAKLWAAGAMLTQIERSTGVSRGVAIGRIHRACKAGDPRFAIFASGCRRRCALPSARVRRGVRCVGLLSGQSGTDHLDGAERHRTLLAHLAALGPTLNTGDEKAGLSSICCRRLRQIYD